MNRYDTIVVGLGAMGSAACAALAGRGVAVLGIEQFQPVHDRGSSHGDSRIVRMAYFEDPAYVPLLRRAYQGWAALEQSCGQQLITWTGALMIGRPASAVVAGTLASVASWDLPHELLDRPAMAQRFGQFRLRDDEVAVYERDAGAVDPEAAIRAFHEQARAAGAELRFESPVDGWDVTDDGVVVRFGTEVAVAGHLVVASGTWAGKLLGGGLSLSPERTVTYHVEPVDHREAFAPDRFPAFVWELTPGDAIYGVADVGRGSTQGRLPSPGSSHRSGSRRS